MKRTFLLKKSFISLKYLTEQIHLTLVINMFTYNQIIFEMQGFCRKGLSNY